MAGRKFHLPSPPRVSIFFVFEGQPASHLVSLQRDGKEVFPSVNQGVGVFC